jgi:hypothetical protein
MNIDEDFVLYMAFYFLPEILKIITTFHTYNYIQYSYMCLL